MRVRRLKRVAGLVALVVLCSAPLGVVQAALVWQTETVDATGGVGYDTSLALDSQNQPHISYQDSTNAVLKYATFDGAAWQTETVDAEGFVGWYTSLAIDSQNQPHISYQDFTNEDLKYAELVNNEPPTVEAGGPYSGDEGSPISPNGTVADLENDPLTTTWSYTANSADLGTTCTFGDPSQVDTTFTCDDDGSFTLTLTADDGVNPLVMANAAVTVSNAAPAVTLGADVEINEGDGFSGNGSFTDPGANDTHTATVDYGDGSGDQPLALNPDGSFDLNHDYLADDGQYDIEVCVTDDDQGSGCDELQLTVLNVAPTITDITSSVSGAEATITVTATDPAGPNDPLSYAFDCNNDGDYEVDAGATNSATCTLGTSEGAFLVGVQVSDGDGGVATDTVMVTVVTHLCASNYTGVLRYTSDCQDHEIAVSIPGAEPVEVCASNYNGLLRLPVNSNGHCADHETSYLLPEDGPLNVCVSNHTQTMRAVDDIAQCTSNEFGRVIAATEVGGTTPPRSR